MAGVYLSNETVNKDINLLYKHSTTTETSLLCVYAIAMLVK